LRQFLPKGSPISDELWGSRHRTVITLLWLHIVGLGVYGIIRSFGLLHLTVELGAIIAITLAARAAPTRLGQASLGTLGLVSCSGLLVHLSGGLIEAHFHFFVVIVVVTLYQSWIPFLLALAFVVIHHGTVGVLDPEAVYNHPAAVHKPWLWAGIHGLFILGAAAAALASWNHAEMERERAEEAAVMLHDRALRHREAIQLNDTVVQGLAAAKYAAQLGDADQASATVERTLEVAKQLVAELMEGDADLFEPGGLRRDTPAGARGAR
jgi:signal transduction histidine kinase